MVLKLFKTRIQIFAFEENKVIVESIGQSTLELQLILLKLETMWEKHELEKEIANLVTLRFLDRRCLPLVPIFSVEIF